MAIPKLTLMNFVDLLIIVLIVGSAWRGIRRGLVEGIFHFIVLSISLVATLLLYGIFQRVIHDHMNSINDYAFPIAIVGTFLLLRVLFTMLIDQLFGDVSNDIERAQWNKLLGFIPGIFTGFIYAIFITVFFSGISVEVLRKQTAESYFAQTFVKPAGWFHLQLYKPKSDKPQARDKDGRIPDEYQGR